MFKQIKKYFVWLAKIKKESYNASIAFLLAYGLVMAGLIGGVFIVIFQLVGLIEVDFYQVYIIVPLLFLPFGVWLVTKYPMIGIVIGVLSTAIGGYAMSFELSPSGGYIDAMFIYGLILFASYHFHRLALKGLKIKFNEDVKNEVA